MATTTSHEPSAGSETRPVLTRPPARRNSTRIIRWLALFGLGGAAVVVLAAMVLSGVTGSSDANGGAMTHSVRRGRLLVTVTEDGNVESASNVDVKCQVAGGATILWIVEDGKEVKEGEVIVRLDESAIIDQINAQTIVYQKAMATKIQAEEDLSAAKIGVEEYKEGTFVKELQLLEAQIRIALENLRSAENIRKHTKTMARKGFATPLQLEADEFAVERAQLELESAETAKKVLVDFTKKKTIKELEALRDSTEARMRSETAAFELEEARLKRLQEQMKNCTLTAPANGMVVWANDNGGRRRSNDTPAIEEGAVVREGQTLIRLPDLTQMQVKVAIHETKVDQIELGMPARIVILDREFPGSVVSIANQPEPGSWYSSEVKQYGAAVKIEGEPTGLRPGMTAEVEILIHDLRDVLTVPVQAVVEQRGKFFCWVQSADKPERRPVVLGSTNDKLIEIKDGVSEGEQVILNPRAIISEARETESTGEEKGEQSWNGSGRSEETGGGSGGSQGQVTENSSSGPSDDADPGSQADSARSDRRAGPGGGEPGQRRRGGAGMMSRLMQMDRDGDQRISREEAPEQMQSRFDRMDVNGDGFIDQADIAERMRQRSEGAGPGRPGDRGGDP